MPVEILLVEDIERLFFQNFQKFTNERYARVKLLPCVDRIPPTTQGCIRIMFGTVKCVQLVLFATYEKILLHNGQFNI